DRDGVHTSNRTQVLGRTVDVHGERTVCTVHVQPHTQLTTDVRDLLEGIDCTGDHGPGGTRNEHQAVACGHIAFDSGSQLAHLHSLPGVPRDPADRVGAKAREVVGLVNPCVCLARLVYP